MKKDLFDENIIKLLGLETLPIEEKQVMLNKMSDLVWKRLILKIVDDLPEDKVKELGSAESKPEELVDFITANVPNFEDLLKEEIVALKEELVKAADQS